MRDHSNEGPDLRDPLRIVLIEDDENTREAFAELLTSNGYSVIAEADGVAGISTVCRMQPDIVVTDIMLPLLNGRDIARILHANPPTQHIPIIVTTAETTVPGPGDAGLFTAVLHKPFALPDLLDAIDHAMPQAAA